MRAAAGGDVRQAVPRLSPPLVDALRTAAEWRKNKLTASEYDRRDDLVSADVDGLRDAAAFRRGAAVDGAGGGGGPRPVGGGRTACAVRASALVGMADGSGWARGSHPRSRTPRGL